MPVVTRTLECKTRGFTDMLDITREVENIVRESGIQNGIVTIFVPGSTGGLTTIEYEPGLKKDLPEILEQIAPMNRKYHHDATWHDGNGYAHIRAALIGPSLTVPFSNQTLHLGTWQQIVFLDFDNRPRQRQLVLQILGD